MAKRFSRMPGPRVTEIPSPFSHESARVPAACHDDLREALEHGQRQTSGENHGGEGSRSGDDGHRDASVGGRLPEAAKPVHFVQKYPDTRGPVPRRDSRALRISAGWDDEGGKAGRGQVRRAKFCLERRDPVPLTKWAAEGPAAHRSYEATERDGH